MVNTPNNRLHGALLGHLHLAKEGVYLLLHISNNNFTLTSEYQTNQDFIMPSSCPHIEHLHLHPGKEPHHGEPYECFNPLLLTTRLTVHQSRLLLLQQISNYVAYNSHTFTNM